MTDQLLDQVARWLAVAERAVAFTGAGISTESGIPDFRSPGGIWAQTQPVYFDEFLHSEEARYEYWRQKAVAHRDFADAEPNAGHRVLAAWEQAGRLRGVITQNIDGMHQLAGSREVLELHGTAREVACLECEARFDAEPMVARFLADDVPPSCPECGGLVKHATISFGQQLSPEVLQRATQWARQTDLMIVAGSSLVVHPAASLPELAVRYRGRLVIINRDATPLDSSAHAVIHASIGETLTAIDERWRSIASHGA